jgi:hypothetical protein
MNVRFIYGFWLFFGYFKKLSFIFDHFVTYHIVAICCQMCIKIESTHRVLFEV